VGAVTGPNLRWHSWQATAVEDEVQDLGVACGIMFPPGPLPTFLAQTSATPLAVMARRAVIERIGGYETSFRGMYEDQVFLAKLFLEAPVYVARDVWHKYRQHDESCVSRAHRDGSQLVARRRFLLWLRRYLATYPELAPVVRPVVDQELARTRLARTRALLRRLR
jgi:hypothetical protein